MSLLRVDLLSGEATPLSTGGELCLPSNLVLETPETVLLACGHGATARVVRVRLEDGEQQLVATGGLLEEPTEVALDSESRVLVADLGPFSFVAGSYQGRIVRIGPEGESLLATGEPLSAPWSLTLDGEGQLIVGNELWFDTEYGIRQVFSLVRVDTASGDQTLLYEDDFQVGSWAETVVLLPEASTATLQLVALTAFLLLGRRAERLEPSASKARRLEAP